MDGNGRMRKMRAVEAALARGLPLCWACRAAGVSEASYRRWKAKAPDGDPAALADRPRSGRPASVVWSEASVEHVRRLYIRSNRASGAGSAALAWRMAAKDPSSPLTDAERAAILGRADKSVPKSARDALRGVGPAVFARYRDPKSGHAGEGVMAPGWLRMLEDGSRRLRPGERQVWDDASVNVGVCVPWSRGGDPCSERYGVRVARFQLLAGIDCATDFCVGTAYVMRPSDGYRAEDVVRAMHGAWRMQGFAPDACVLEGGSWQASRTLEFLEAAGVGVVDAKIRPWQKLVEGWFNRLWTVMSVELPPRGQVGRFRGEMAKETKDWMACQRGERDPRGLFPDLKEFLRALDRSVAYLNADVIPSPEYGTWVPQEKWEAEASKGHALPQWLDRFAMPVRETRKVRRGGMAFVSAEGPFGWGHEYAFAIPDGWMLDGRDVTLAFDPWRIREGAWVEAGGRPLPGRAVCVSPAPDPASERCWLDPRAAAREARRASRAAVAAQVAAYDGRGAMAREATDSASPETGRGVRGGVPPQPEPEDPAEWARRERDFERGLSELREDERRLALA